VLKIEEIITYFKLILENCIYIYIYIYIIYIIVKKTLVWGLGFWKETEYNLIGSKKNGHPMLCTRKLSYGSSEIYDVVSGFKETSGRRVRYTRFTSGKFINRTSIITIIKSTSRRISPEFLRIKHRNLQLKRSETISGFNFLSGKIPFAFSLFR